MGGGTRQWTSDELSTLRKMQTRMTRCLCHMWPFVDEDWPTIMRRTCRWAEELWTAAGTPRYNEAIAATWWRWSGHAARYPAGETSRIVSTAIRWRDTWWRWTIKAVHISGDAEGPQRLGRGHRTFEKRRWDNPTQSIVLAASHTWHGVAHDKQTWKHMEIYFVRRVTRMQRDMHVPAGRWMMEEVDASQASR